MSAAQIGRVQMTDIDDATLAEIEQELQGDGVWVDPAFAREHDVSAADEAALVETVATTEAADLRVVLVAVDSDDERFHGAFSNLSAWLRDGTGEDATYVGWNQWSEPQLSVQEYGSQQSSGYVDNVAAHEHPDDIVAQVERVGELIDDGNAEQLWREVPTDERYSWTADEGGVPGWLIGLGVAAVVAGAAVAWRRLRTSRRRDRTAGFALPDTVLHTVREAEDQRLRRQADTDVLALGEALGRGEHPGSTAALDAWRQALDHYAAARSTLEKATAPADVVGAIVLARRGDSARRSAQRPGAGAWEPPRGCWFNPLHEGPAVEVTWRDGERSVEVPACGECADAVRSGREPDDVLDFIRGDRTVHYFRLDLGAWSETGYGSLKPDLLGALRRSRR